MICLPGMGSISAEARAMIDSRPFTRDGMRKLAALLPSDDAELSSWLSDAYAAHEAETFHTLWGAACAGERTLPTALIQPAYLMRCGALQVAWAAWRMKEAVAEELLRTLDSVPHGAEVRALFLFVAAAWWLKHHEGEEMPREIAHWVNLTSQEKKLSIHAIAYLKALVALLGLWPLLRISAHSPGAIETRKQLTWLRGILDGPFDRFLREQAVNIYEESLPQRRAVEDIGRNQKCHCGSEQKYKRCCEKKDRVRLSGSSSIPGMTCAEIAQEQHGLITIDRLHAMKPTELLHLDPKQIAPEGQDQFIFTLSLLGYFDAALAAFEHYGVPGHLHSVWSTMFEHALKAWRPDVARRLLEIFPDAEEKLGQKAHPGIKLLLVGDDPAKLLETTEAELRHQLEGGESEDLRRLVWTVMQSPYRSLGIFLARSLLPIVEEGLAPCIFESILEARAKLNLTPDDEFSDFMDERALRAARDHDTAALDQAKEKLTTNNEQLRCAKEERAGLEREVKLLRKKEHASLHVAEKPADRSNYREEEKIRELKAKIDRLSAVVSEGARERQALRQNTEKLTRENEAIRAAQEIPEKSKDEEDERDLEFEGNQPVRLIDFPEDFAETLAQFPTHVGRAVMKRIGLIAAGDNAGFDKVKQIKAYPGVLRARVSDKFRLFFTLTPDRVRIIDLIWRDDLDRWIKQLLARGLPTGVK